MAGIGRHTPSLGLPSISSFFFCERNREKYFSLIDYAKPLGSSHDQGSRSACAAGGVEGESLFAADGRYRCGRKRIGLFCGLRFSQSGEHDPHPPRGRAGSAGAAAIAVLPKPAVSAVRNALSRFAACERLC
jgi:hypothetical protein